MLKKLIPSVIIVAMVVIPIFTPPVSAKVTEKSHYTVQQLEEALLYELKPLAADFINAEEKYGVNALYLASIAALESGWGRYCFKENNIFGFGNKKFQSKQECIDFVAAFLSENYLNHNGIYYNGVTLSAVNMHYNGSDFWLTEVEKIKSQIERRCIEAIRLQ